MENPPEMLDYVKATFDAGRLRIIGVLAQHPATVRSVADELKIPFRQAFNHLAYLEHVGVVHKEGDIFTLDETGLEALSKRQFASQREAYIPAPELDLRTRKVLAAHLNADGSIKQIPYQSAKLQILLNYLISAFTTGVNYTEGQVNDILRRFHEDTAGLRRDLVEAGLLSRESDGSRYWRSPELGEGRSPEASEGKPS